MRQALRSGGFGSPDWGESAAVAGRMDEKQAARLDVTEGRAYTRSTVQPAGHGPPSSTWPPALRAKSSPSQCLAAHSAGPHAWAVASGSLPLVLSFDPGKGFSGSVPRVTVRTRRRGLGRRSCHRRVGCTGPQPRPWAAGIIDHETGKRDIRRLSGLRHTIFSAVATDDGAPPVARHCGLQVGSSSASASVDAVVMPRLDLGVAVPTVGLWLWRGLRRE